MSSSKVHFKNLDALRFFAFLSVFISHVTLFLGYENHSANFQNIERFFLIHGDLGVNFFFVLSGFLITFLLLQESAKFGHISFRHFYLRRILRIWPLYFLTLILGFLITYKLAPNSGIAFPFEINESLSYLPWYIFLAANLKMAFIGTRDALLAVLWSVSVEEQFYLVWPALLSFFSRKNIVSIMLLILSFSFLYRFLNYDDYDIVKYSTFSVMSDLVIGALAAYVTIYVPSICKRIENLPKLAIVSLYIIGFALVPLRTLLPDLLKGNWYRFTYTFEPLVFSVFFAFIILEQNISKNSFTKFGNLPILNYLGVRSYGLYCYHMIALFFTLYILGTPSVDHNFLLPLLEVAVVFFLTCALSIFSYSFFEKKFLFLKEKYGYRNFSL